MTLFRSYLRTRRGVLLALMLCAAIFGVTFALYRLPLRAVAYPTALCLAVLLLLGVADFARVRQRHMQLTLPPNADATLPARLPEPAGIEAQDYQAIIAALRAQYTAQQCANDARCQDMLDYYTVWAHQIKTPIAAMQLTLDGEDSPAARQLASELRRIEQYADMVLAYLRLDSRDTDYVFRRQPLDPIIRQSVRRFSAEFISRRIGLDYTPVEAEIVTDEKWLGFVLEQLLSNALKYTPSGTIRIFLAEPLTLCIADTGIGIAPDDLPRIFEKGYTGANGRADRRASGLGLYLCRRVCKQLGLTLRAESAPGAGTRIYLGLTQYPLRPE